MSAAHGLADYIADCWDGGVPLAEFLAAPLLYIESGEDFFRESDGPEEEVLRLAHGLAPFAACFPATGRETNGGWVPLTDLVLSIEDLASLFAAGVLRREPCVDSSGAVYIEIASERTLRGLR